MPKKKIVLDPNKQKLKEAIGRADKTVPGHKVKKGQKQSLAKNFKQKKDQLIASLQPKPLYDPTLISQIRGKKKALNASFEKIEKSGPTAEEIAAAKERIAARAVAAAAQSSSNNSAEQPGGGRRRRKSRRRRRKSRRKSKRRKRTKRRKRRRRTRRRR